MSDELIGLLSFIILLLAILARLPIAIALLLVGFGGYAVMDGWRLALLTLGGIPFDLAHGYSLSVVPLFVLMGAVASRAGMSRELYQASLALFSGRGALANATIGACALFGAVCGSSLATAATMARVSVPEMRTFGYSASLAAGAVASGGTLGILIPPSVILVLYAIIAEASVPELFAAGLLPGIVLALLHVLVVKGWVWLQPSAAPPTDASMPWPARLRAMLGMWKLAVLFLLAVGGIYLGWFSPTEAAAVGAFGAIVIALVTRTLDLRGLWDALNETVSTTGMLFFVMVGAFLFARFVVITRLPSTLTETVMSWDLPTIGVLLLMVGFYLLLGCFLGTVSMILITVPVFLPLIEGMGMGLSPVWFGVLLVVVAEVGLIPPPVGLNIFCHPQSVAEYTATHTVPRRAAVLIGRYGHDRHVADHPGVGAVVARPAVSLASSPCGSVVESGLPESDLHDQGFPEGWRTRMRVMNSNDSKTTSVGPSRYGVLSWTRRID